MKNTICLITNWYPTKENPYAGLFFKEQAFAVAEKYDFLVVHYREHIKKSPFFNDKVTLINREKNTVEYDIDVYVPLSLYLYDVAYDQKRRIGGKTQIDGVGRYVSKKRSQFTRKAIVKAFEKNINIAFDALYCVDAQKEAFYLQCLAEHFKKPYVVGEHAPFPWPGTVIRDINKNAIEKADAFLAISQDKIRQLMIQNIKLPRTFYIGNLINEDSLSLNNNHHEDKTFIIIAAHSFYKNYEMFIDVMNRLTEIANRKFNIMIVGYASNKGYSKNVDEFERKISASKFADNVEMIPSVSHFEIDSVLNKADAFVMTSIQEGQPVSAMEAACCGLPIFSTRCGGVEDYVNDDIGRLYNITDSEGMAEGLNSFLNDEIAFEPLVIRNSVIEKFGKKTFTETFSKIFDSVINGL